MKRTLKTLLTASAAVAVIGFATAAVIDAPALAFGGGYGHGWHHGGGPHMTMAQGQPGMGPGMGMMGGRMQQRMMQLDTDKDGAVSKAEFQAMHDQRFTALDADKDGTVSQDEFVNADPQAMGMGMGPGWNADAMPEAMKDMMAERRAFMFRGLDADDSRTLTKDELAAHAEPRFEMIDANDDGKITPDEMGRMGPRGMNGPGQGMGQGMGQGPAQPAPAQ
ncbi:EF-hand domain-containing protein [Caenispirillum bisanense]|uniref:EF hand n=1 Tax=Caenispirillum bisanense TaxID=414052 RepID=A0A286GLW4_9PROT|nr:EF-hand domain-containing protein [Caenispirillum bisanense]SOD95974.1 EF hand [Caenispirillum bisanense]